MRSKNSRKTNGMKRFSKIITRKSPWFVMAESIARPNSLPAFFTAGFCLFRPGRFRPDGPGASRPRPPARWTRFPPWPHLGSGMPRLRPVPRPRRIAFQGATHVFLHRKPPGFHIPANSPARQEDAAAAFHHVPRKLTNPKKDQPNATGRDTGPQCFRVSRRPGIQPTFVLLVSPTACHIRVSRLRNGTLSFTGIQTPG